MRIKQLSAARAGVLDYIRSMAEQLAAEAKTNGFESLAYILAMAREDANRQLAEYEIASGVTQQRRYRKATRIG